MGSQIAPTLAPRVGFSNVQKVGDLPNVVPQDAALSQLAGASYASSTLIPAAASDEQLSLPLRFVTPSQSGSVVELDHKGESAAPGSSPKGMERLMSSRNIQFHARHKSTATALSLPIEVQELTSTPGVAAPVAPAEWGLDYLATYLTRQNPSPFPEDLKVKLSELNKDLKSVSNRRWGYLFVGLLGALQAPKTAFSAYNDPLKLTIASISVGIFGILVAVAGKYYSDKQAESFTSKEIERSTHFKKIDAVFLKVAVNLLSRWVRATPTYGNDFTKEDLELAGIDLEKCKEEARKIHEMVTKQLVPALKKIGTDMAAYKIPADRVVDMLDPLQNAIKLLDPDLSEEDFLSNSMLYQYMLLRDAHARRLQEIINEKRPPIPPSPQSHLEQLLSVRQTHSPAHLNTPQITQRRTSRRDTSVIPLPRNESEVIRS